MTDAADTPPPLRIKPLDIAALYDRPRPVLDFVLPGLLTGTVGVIVGQGNVGKSWLVLQLLASVAVGRDVWGLIGEDPKSQHVALISAEDPGSNDPDDTSNVLGYRLHVLASALFARVKATHGEEAARIALGDLAGRLRIFPGYGHDLAVLDNKGAPNARAIEFFEAVAKDNFAIIGVDTLRRVHRADENDNGAMATVLGIFERCTKLGRKPSFLILHHTGKGASREGNGDEQTAARGASSITDNARFQANMVGMSKEEAEARGLDDEERRRWARYVVPKLNYAANPGGQWLRRGEGGVLERAEPPAPEQKPKNGNRPKGTF